MQTIWFTSDSHFCHGQKINEEPNGIIKYCSRPYKCFEEMNEDLIEKWNSVVKPDDIIYHLGDFGYGRNATIEALQTILNSLNGVKYLIEGNHDKKLGSKLKGWEKISKYEEIKIFHNNDTYPISMFHYPIESWNNMYYKAIHLHGHCHGTLPEYNLRLDVGVDSWNGYPVNFEQILERLSTLPPSPLLGET